MKLIKILIAAIFAFTLIGSSPTWVRAADTKDKAATTSETNQEIIEGMREDDKTTAEGKDDVVDQGSRSLIRA